MGFHNSESYDFVDFLPLSNYVQVFSYFKVLTLMEATLFFTRFLVGQLVLPVARAPMPNAAADLSLDTGKFLQNLVV